MTPDDEDPIRVLVVDDHAVVRRGLFAFLDARAGDLDDHQLRVGEDGHGRRHLQRTDVDRAFELLDLRDVDLDARRQVQRQRFDLYGGQGLQ